MSESPRPFPSSPVDNGEQLYNLLGSFWTTLYDGDPFISGWCAGRSAQERQTLNDLRELIAATDPNKCPIHHTVRCYPLQLSPANMDAGDWNMSHFGDSDLVFSSPATAFFGSALSNALYAWPLPDNVIDIPVLTNRINQSSLTLVNHVDYVINVKNDINYVVFRNNPLLSENVLIDIDGSTTLWGLNVSVDHNYLQRLYGCAFGLNIPSTAASRQFIASAIKLLNGNSSCGAVKEAVAACTGAPLAADGETVQSIITQITQTTVVTDQHVYTLPPAATLQLAVGDVLSCNQPIGDACLFFDFNRGQAIDAGLLPSLAAGQNLLATGYFADLIFINQNVPLIVTTDVNGYTRLSWQLGGWPGDVQKFFDDLHANGLAAGATLAMLLDQRPISARSTQPTALALPVEINPLQFLLSNIWRNSLFLVRIRPASFGVDALGLSYLRVLRKLLPPQSLVILAVVLDAGLETINMDEDGSTDNAGGDETVTGYLSQAINETLSGPAFISEQVKIFSLAGQCG